MDANDRIQQDSGACALKTFIGDVGKPFTTPLQKLCVVSAMTVFSLVLGLILGLAVWALYWFTISATNFFWTDGIFFLSNSLEQAGLESWWLPICLCALGGLVTGLWLSRFGGAPKPLNKVLGSIKETGGYTLDRSFACVVTLVLPFLFGGAIGLLAGLLGIIVAATTKIGRLLKVAGLGVKRADDFAVGTVLTALVRALRLDRGSSSMERGSEEPNIEDYDFRRGFKVVLYSAAALGAVGGVALLAAVLGNPWGLNVLIPRFGQVSFGANELWWALPCLAAGYIGALMFKSANTVFSWLGEKLSSYTVALSVIAGVVLGCLYLPLPDVLFSGQIQSFGLMEGWQAVGAATLLATGCLKCVATPLCLNFGWRGGHFFPCAFAGMSLGYGLAALLGIEPMYAVTLTTAALLGAIQRQPILIIALMLLCFPVKSIPWIALACFIGSKLPMPKRLLKAQGQ